MILKSLHSLWPSRHRDSQCLGNLNCLGSLTQKPSESLGLGHKAVIYSNKYIRDYGIVKRNGIWVDVVETWTLGAQRTASEGGPYKKNSTPSS